MNNLLPKIDAYHLLIFYFVAKEKGISAAAKKLFLSQPTVTNHIKSLEQSLQLELIRTEGKNQILTYAGEGLYQYAKEILQNLLAADRFIETIKDSHFKIGVPPLFVKVASNIINDISEQHDRPTKMSIRFGESYSLLTKVVDSKLDLAVVTNLDAAYPQLNRQKIGDNIKLVFYASPSHPIFGKRSIKWLDLGAYLLAVGTDMSSIKRLVSNKLILEGLVTPPKFYLCDYDIVFFKNIVRKGEFISLALKQDIERELDEGILKIIPLPSDLSVTVNIVGYKRLLANPIAKQFISYAKETFSNLEVYKRKRMASRTPTSEDEATNILT